MSQEIFVNYVRNILKNIAGAPKPTLKELCLLLYSVALLGYAFPSEKQSTTFQENGKVINYQIDLMKKISEHLKSIKGNEQKIFQPLRNINQKDIHQLKLLERFFSKIEKINSQKEFKEFQRQIDKLPAINLKTHESQFQEKIHAILQAILKEKDKGQIQLEKEKVLDGILPIDSYFKIGDEEFCINIDGTFHFTAYQKKEEIILAQSPKDKMHDKILQKKDRHIFRIAYYELPEKQQEWKKYIAEKLEAHMQTALDKLSNQHKITMST